MKILKRSLILLTLLQVYFIESICPGGGFNSSMNNGTMSNNTHLGFVGSNILHQLISLQNSLSSGSISQNQIQQSLGVRSGSYTVCTNTSVADGPFVINGTITVPSATIIHVPTNDGYVVVNGIKYSSGQIQANVSVVQDQADGVYLISNDFKVEAFAKIGTFEAERFFKFSGDSITIQGDLELDGQDSAYANFGTPGTSISCEVQGDLYIHNAFNNNISLSPSSIVAIFIYSNSLQVSGEIILNDNNVSTETLLGSAIGVSVTNEGSFNATNITMNANSATSTNTDAYAVRFNNYSGTITMTNITMNDNSATSTSANAYGVNILNLATIATANVIFTLTGTSFDDKHINALNSLFRNSTDTANLPFTDFTITIDSDSYGSSGGNYTAMQTAYPNVILLNAGNQS